MRVGSGMGWVSISPTLIPISIFESGKNLNSNLVKMIFLVKVEMASDGYGRVLLVAKPNGRKLWNQTFQYNFKESRYFYFGQTHVANEKQIDP